MAASALSAFSPRTDDPRLLRLDERTRAAVSAVVEGARREGLPTEPLIDKALEGASKRAPGPSIVNVVKSWVADLRRAREALYLLRHPLMCGWSERAAGRPSSRRAGHSATVELE